MKLTTAKTLILSTALVIACIAYIIITFIVRCSYQIILLRIMALILLLVLGFLQIAKFNIARKNKRDSEFQVDSENKSEEKFRKAFHDNVAGVVIWDKDGKYIDVNQAFLLLVEYSREEILGKTSVELGFISAQERTSLIEELDQKGRIVNRELQIKTKSGHLKVVLASFTVIKINRQIERLTTFIDITEKKQAEEELKQANEHLHRLSSHLETVREEERISIAREIHDELGQQLTGLKMDIHWLNKRLPDASAAVRTKLNDALELISETIKSVTRISSNLRPYILDDLGLISALEWQNGELAKRFEINVNFVSDIKEIDIPELVKTGVFRIYQEVLTNAVRHANATEINSTLHFEDNCIIMEVKDNGSGFNPKSLNKKTFGLLGIQERTYAMDGRYELTSEPGKGTSVWISIPLL